jgi:hypothetical protein
MGANGRAASSGFPAIACRLISMFEGRAVADGERVVQLHASGA